jgi:hypothetical protein
MRLLDYVQRYALSRDVSADYIDQLACCVRALERTLGQPVQVDQLSPDLVNQFLHQQKAAGLCCTTRKNRRRMLLTLWRSAALAGLVAPPGLVPIAPVRQCDHLVASWSADQVRQLLATADGLEGVIRKLDIPKAHYWGSYVPAGWDTGLRGCDVRRFERPHIGPDGTVRLVQVKTGRSKRVKLRPSTVDRIDQSLAACPRQLIWPLWADVDQWRKQARKLVDRAGLPGSIGRLRHSSGTEVELAHPGRGHEHLGNTRAVFLLHYFDDSRAVYDRPMPQEL